MKEGNQEDNKKSNKEPDRSKLQGLKDNIFVKFNNVKWSQYDFKMICLEESHFYV